MSAGKICSRVVVFATKGETVRDAARRMSENNVGTLVVVDEDRRPAGILTDRDIVTRVLAQDRDPMVTTLDEIMTRDPRTIGEATAIEEALRIMQHVATRRLVVVSDDGRLAGILSVDDILELRAREAAAIGTLIRREAPVIVG
jgi:CBS domain-containing protein